MKPGFKQTELGVVPDKWEVTTIGEQSQIFGRIGFRGYTVHDIVEEGRGAIAINPSNIEDGKITFEKCTYISWPKYEESPEIKIDEGDIILVKTGSTVGKTAMVKMLPEKATLNPQVIVFKSLKASPGFFGYMIGFSTVQKQITEAVVGGAVPTLSQKLVAAFKFPLPPQDEQRAIAEALGDADALIESLERLIAKKRDIKQGAMQELLTGKRRLPGFTGKWEMKPLGKIADVIMGQSPSSIYYNTKGIGLPLIQGNADILNRRTIQRIFTTDVTKHGKAGDIVLSVRAPVGEVARAMFDVCLGRGVCAVRYANDFLYHALIAQEPTWSRLSKGSTFDSVTSSDVKAFAINLPATVAEQLAVAQVLSDMDAEISVLEAKLSKARAIKQGMMQELLTGRIRLI